MGPRNRTKTRRPKGNRLQGIPHDANRRRSPTQVPEGHAEKGVHLTIEVPIRIILLLHSEERR
jgi:hypothetical protein